MLVMEKPENQLICYISSLLSDKLDPYLEKNGLTRGLVIFSIPSFGVLFKCRVEGEPIELEFAAFFSLLKFIETSFGKKKIKAVKIFSSNPEFIFSFSDNSRHLSKGTEKFNLLQQYASKMTIAVALVEKIKNRALVPSGDYPSLPVDRKLDIDMDFIGQKKKNSFKPFQKGIRL
ncbi:MAG: hypothetical protein ACOYVF_10525 [Candidatus Zixiibacteriota bacterium]